MANRKLLTPLVGIIAFLLAACNTISDSETPAFLEAQAQPVRWSETRTLPIDASACLNEPVFATITVHFMVFERDNPTGRSLYKQIARPEVAGVDAVVVGAISGTEYNYRVVGAHQITDIMDDGEDRVFIFTNNIRLIGQGQHPNLLVNFRIRYIVNAQGDTVVFEGIPPSLEATCTGRR